MSGRLFLCGDTHRHIDIEKLRKLDCADTDKGDILVILGDAGFVWDGTSEEHYWQEFISNKPWTTFCVLGNHEAYDLIEKYPLTYFCGGTARKITKSLYYAVTGEVYDLNGHPSLVINGADSHDRFNSDGTINRIEGINWWKEERIRQEDIDEILKKKIDVDMILTHTGGSEVCKSLSFEPTISDIRLDKILTSFNYNRHYCGHYHCDQIISRKSRVLYDDIIEIY